MHQAKTPSKTVTPLQLLLIAAVTPLLAAPAAIAQLPHRGPASDIALSKTLAPYDVISIKPHNTAKDLPLEQTFSISTHDDTLSATNVPVVMLIEFAYDVKEDQIFGLSGPLTNAHYDIEAKIVAPDGGTPPKLTDPQLEAMVIPLLADRFHLKVHIESKILPVYDLVVAKGGLKIKLSATQPSDNSWNLNATDTSKVLSAKSVSMADLAQAVSGEVHRQVIDKTGLTGSADISLKWSDEVAAEQGGNTVSIFTALEEELGVNWLRRKARSTPLSSITSKCRLTTSHGVASHRKGSRCWLPFLLLCVCSVVYLCP